MKNGIGPQEKISAFADGELEPNELDAVLAGLRQPEALKEWDIYHQIGDVLRSDDMAVNMSPDFAARMAAKLEAEPVILAPAALSKKTANVPHQDKNEALKRYAFPGIAAALAVFTAYLISPQLTTDGSSNSEASSSSAALASASSRAAASANSASVTPAGASASASGSVKLNQEAVVLRDPNIDEYLIAHQRYSPSLYDTSQFVRSATFETEPQK